MGSLRVAVAKRKRHEVEDSYDDEDDVGPTVAPSHKRFQQDGSDEESGSGDDDEPAQPSGSDDEDEDEVEDSEDGSSDEDDEDGPDAGRTLEEQVADIPFETLEALKRDGRGPGGRVAQAAAHKALQMVRDRKFKRDNKDRPQEMSSKRPVGRFREVIQVPNSGRRDPRFDESGPMSPAANDAFRKRYSFVYNDLLPKEKAELQAKIKKEQRPGAKAKLQSALSRVDDTLRQEDLRRRTQAMEDDWKSKERGAVKSGKQPFFLKAADKKRIALLAKYQELKEHGKLDKFMEKRRKKNASKDHRYLPSGRRDE